MADETAVVDAGTPVDTSAAVDTTQTATDTPAVSTTPAVDTPAIDPNDPMAALEAAMNAQLGPDEPAEAPVTPETPAIPPQFEQALQISEFVKEPQHVEAAIRAADEVWKVATGQTAASSLLEGMRAANPQGFAGVVENLTQYIEQITGKKFGDAPATPPDPNQARLDAIEKRFAADEQARQTAQWNQQAESARGKALEFLTGKAKGTFAEGQEAYLLQQAGAKAGIPEQEMIQALLTGKTDKLEAAYRAVVKEETARLRAYNQNLVKQHRKLANAVPGVKGPQAGTQSTDKLPGESTAQHAARLWKNGLV